LARIVGQNVAQTLHGIDHGEGHRITVLTGLAVTAHSLLRRGWDGGGNHKGEGDQKSHTVKTFLQAICSLVSWFRSSQ
jgi:hypothetical protein